MTKIKDGTRYDLVLQHGVYTAENIRALNQANVNHTHAEGDPVTEDVSGEVRVFQQDGETRYEVIVTPDTSVECPTCHGTGQQVTVGERVGFLPDHVLQATES